MGNRKIDKIIVHHSKSGSETTIDQIDSRQRYKGRDGIGYHYVILSDGKVKRTRHPNKTGEHCKDNDVGSIGVCVVGNFELENMSDKQEVSLFDLLNKLVTNHKLEWFDVYTHKELASNTMCCGESLHKAVMRKRIKESS
tara:strand:+ start:7038 stop:7457 length:420 start_codon:yes stop_codon:yes gene_type:complete